jgi:hypothetical protein
MSDLTYNQVLSDIYEENARDLYVHQTEYSDDEDKPAYQETDYDVNELEDPEEFNQFGGDRGQPSHVIQASAKDQSKSSVKSGKGIRTIVLNIDSSFRTNQSNAPVNPDTTYTLPRNQYGVPPLPLGALCHLPDVKVASPISNYVFNLSRLYRNITTVKLTSVEFNNSFYAFSSNRGNTSFTITFTPSGGSASVYTITIPDGNYPNVVNPTTGTIYLPSPPAVSPNTTIDNTTLLGIIQTAINGTALNTIITIKYSPSQHVVYFECGTSLDTTIINFPLNGIGYNLGFIEIEYLASLVAIPDGSGFLNPGIIAENSPDSIKDNYIYLRINDWNLLDHQGMNQTVFSAFAKLQLPVDKNTTVFDNNYTNSSTKEYKFEKPVNIQKLNISVLDAYGNILNLRNNFSFTIELGQINDNSIYEKLLED